MKKTLFRLLSVSLAALSLSACGSFNAYREGVAGNVATYRSHVSVMMSQQNTLNSCFNAAGATNSSSDLALCAVLAASTNTTQVLAGKPEPIRVAKSKEEILESITNNGLDATVKVFGFKAVSQAIGKGFDALAVQPEVVRPEIVRPEVVRPEVVTLPSVENAGTP